MIWESHDQKCLVDICGIFVYVGLRGLESVSTNQSHYQSRPLRPSDVSVLSYVLPVPFK